MESVRHWFTSSFLLVIGSILVFIQKMEFNNIVISFISCVMFLFSFIGLNISTKCGIMVRTYGNSIEAILNDLVHDEDKNPFRNSGKSTEEIPSISEAYNLFFKASICIWLIILVISLGLLIWKNPVD
jgi:hypothetical protein